MKKKTVIASILVTSLLAGAVFAQTSGIIGTGNAGTGQNTYWQKLQAQSEIMKQLKERDKVALQQLYNNGLNFNEIDIDSAQRDIDDLSNQLNSISTEFTTISTQKKVVNEKYQQVKFAMQQIIDLSNQTKTKVNERATKIRTYTKELMEVKKQMEVIDNDIANAKSLIIRFANVLYRANNEYYNGDMQIDDIKLLIKSDNIADTLSAEELVKILALRFDQLISYLNNQQTTLEERRKRLDILRMQYKNEVSEYNNEIELLKEQRKYLLEFLNLYRQDKINLDLKSQNLFDDRESIKKELDSQIESAQNQLKGSLKDQLAQMDDMEESSRFIGWPVFPVYHYTDAKKDTTYTDIYGENNLGIDISSKQYNPVYAPADGVVISTRDANGISLNRIVIAHKYGYVTVMSSLNKIYVKKGDIINRGQLIGISGGEPGTRGAGFASNGPKLHLEVFKNGLPVHPFTTMDLSVIQNPQIIPFEFEFKLLTDKESREIKLDAVEIMPGKTLAERRRQYLERYGFGEFASLSVWEDAATDHKVDIDMGICIATAESGMGRNLSSARNVGNVGNNDRGDRIDFESPAQGAGMIYYALENKHLGGYDTIYELSGYGNKKGAIYASSEINWMTNVSKCLTAIKGFWIPEHYPFRLPETQDYISGNKKVENGK